MKLTPHVACFILASCAAALVPETSDPNKKIEQAMILVGHGRGHPATKILGEARDKFAKKNDLDGLARTYWAYNALYRMEFKALGYPNYRKAGESFDTSAGYYQKLGQTTTASYGLSLAALMYNAAGDMRLSCNTLKRSRALFSEEAGDRKKFPKWNVEEIAKTEKQYRCPKK